eukprot:gene28182-34030_t
MAAQSFVFLILLFVVAVRGEARRESANKAIIINARLFHYEVVTFFLHHLNAIGLQSEVWLTNYTKLDPMMGSTGPAFLHHYEKNFKYFPDPRYEQNYTKFDGFDNKPFKLLVYINSDENTDINWMCDLGVHDRLMEYADRVLMVVHHAGNANLLAPVCKPPRCALFVLGQHIEDAAIRYLSQRQAHTKVLSAYGIFDLPSLYINEARSLKQHIIQNAAKSKVKTPRHVVIQGSLRFSRRRYKELFQCVDDINKGGAPIKLTLIGGSTDEDKIVVPKSIEPFTTIEADKTFDEFYPIVSSADFVVTFANEGFSYLENRSTSSVTISIVCDVPLAVPHNMLSKYNCLKEQTVHKFIARRTDCASLQAAMKLSDRDIFRMKQEIKYCKDSWRERARAMLKHFAFTPYNGSTAVYEKQCVPGKEIVLDPILEQVRRDREQPPPKVVPLGLTKETAKPVVVSKTATTATTPKIK